MRSSFQALASLSVGSVYVALVSDKVVGSFTLYVLPNLTRNGRRAGLLENVIVDSAHRRQGIGRAMFEHARGLARDAGCCKLSLTSRESRRGAHEFYVRCGMTRHGYSFRYSFL